MHSGEIRLFACRCASWHVDRRGTSAHIVASGRRARSVSGRGSRRTQSRKADRRAYFTFVVCRQVPSLCFFARKRGPRLFRTQKRSASARAAYCRRVVLGTYVVAALLAGQDSAYARTESRSAKNLARIRTVYSGSGNCCGLSGLLRCVDVEPAAGVLCRIEALRAIRMEKAYSSRTGGSIGAQDSRFSESGKSKRAASRYSVCSCNSVPTGSCTCGRRDCTSCLAGQRKTARQNRTACRRPFHDLPCPHIAVSTSNIAPRRSVEKPCASSLQTCRFSFGSRRLRCKSPVLRARDSEDFAYKLLANAFPDSDSRGPCLGKANKSRSHSAALRMHRDEKSLERNSCQKGKAFTY